MDWDLRTLIESIAFSAHCLLGWKPAFSCLGLFHFPHLSTYAHVFHKLVGLAPPSPSSILLPMVKLYKTIPFRPLTLCNYGSGKWPFKGNLVSRTHFTSMMMRGSVYSYYCSLLFFYSFSLSPVAAVLLSISSGPIFRDFWGSDHRMNSMQTGWRPYFAFWKNTGANLLPFLPFCSGHDCEIPLDARTVE